MKYFCNGKSLFMCIHVCVCVCVKCVCVYISRGVHAKVPIKCTQEVYLYIRYSKVRIYTEKRLRGRAVCAPGCRSIVSMVIPLPSSGFLLDVDYFFKKKALVFRKRLYRFSEKFDILCWGKISLLN